MKFKEGIRLYPVTTVLLLCLIWFNNSIAQEMPSLSPNTPEAEALIKEINYPISYYNGLPSINIPIQTIQVQNIALPLNLKYQSNGFKANEQEGVAGLGWTLGTDIQITRVINGLDDFRYSEGNKYGYYYQDEGRIFWQYYDLPDEFNSPLVDLTDFSRHYLRAFHEKLRGNLDIEPDCFYYSLLSGKSGKFYFQKEKGTPLKIVQVPYTGVKIEIPSETKNTDIKGSFKITDLDGTEYYFEGQDTELNTGCLSNNSVVFNNEFGYISSWRCTMIVSADKKESIRFTYEPQINSYTYFGNDYVKLFYNRQGWCYYCGDLGCTYNAHRRCVSMPTEEKLFNAIFDTDSYYNSNNGITESSLTNSLHDDIICRYTNSGNLFQNSYEGYYTWSLYNAPIFYIRSSTNDGSAIVVPVNDGDESDNLIVENKDLDSPIIVRGQERLRLKSIAIPNGQITYDYNDESGQLTEINISNNYRFNKQISFYQTKVGGVNDIYDYASYADGYTYYLDSIVISSSQNKASYKFGYKDKVGFRNYTKSAYDSGEFGPLNQSIEGGFTLYDMYLKDVPDGDGGTRSFVIGKNYRSLGGYFNIGDSDLYEHGTNVTSGIVEAGMLNQIEYPTGLTDHFMWGHNYFYSYPTGGVAGGVRIEEITSKEGSSIVGRRIFKYGRDEDGYGFLKNTKVNSSYFLYGYNTLALPYSFEDKDNNLSRPSFTNEHMLMNYYEDSKYHIIQEEINLSVQAQEFDNETYRSSLDEQFAYSLGYDYQVYIMDADILDPRDKYHYVSLMISDVQTFYKNEYSGSPVYYDMVSEYREEDGKTSGKTIYRYNTDGFGYSFGAYKDGRGFYCPPCDWAYGHLISQIDYKANSENGIAFEPVKSVENKYISKYPSYAILNKKRFENETCATKNKALYAYCLEGNAPNFFEPVLGGIDQGETVLLDSSIVIMHYGNRDVKEVINYEYDSEILLPKKISRTTSNDNVEITELTYSNTACSILRDQYRLNSLIEKNYKINSQPTNSEKYFYSNKWLVDNSLVALEKVQVSDTYQNLENRILYHSYDIYGNPTEISKDGDYHVSYFWKNDVDYPIAQFTNMDRSEIDSNQELLSLLTDLGRYTIITSSNIEDFKIMNSQIRSLLNHNQSVITYTYEPLVGVSSVTDPNGISTFYKYDDFGRLVIVRDNNGHVLKQYKYHYSEPSLSVSPSSINFASGENSSTIQVEANVKWSVSKSDSWLSVPMGIMYNDGVFTINCDANPGGTRTAKVMVSGEGITKIITVTQIGN